MELFICLYVLLMYVHFLEIKYQSINQAKESHQWKVNTGSGNANRPSPEPMSSKIYVATCPQWIDIDFSIYKKQESYNMPILK